MGINSHVLPGDVVSVVSDGTWLFTRHPDEFDPFELLAVATVTTKLRSNTACTVLDIASAGSSDGGHVFFVMTTEPCMFGWLRNHDVRPIVTQRHL